MQHREVLAYHPAAWINPHYGPHAPWQTFGLEAMSHYSPISKSKFDAARPS